MHANAILAQVNAAAQELEDQTKVTTGGDYEPPAAGYTPARFIGYVELGKRKQRPYMGKDKPDADEVRLFFELNGPKHQRQVDIDGETKVFTNIIQFTLTKKSSEKAKFTKLFKKMLYGRSGITHMSQMLGEGFLVQVCHNVLEGKDGKPARTFANLHDADGNWTIGAPMHTDPITNDSTPIPVPEPSVPFKLLFWARPSKEQWDSIFIDGTRTVKDEKGQDKEVSKNWLQETILTETVNFEGSPLQAMLGGLADLTLDAEPEAPSEGNVGAGAVEGTSPDTTGSAGTAEPAKNTSSTGASSASTDDVLASIGLG